MSFFYHLEEDEVTSLLNEWLHDSLLKDISFKAIMMMPNLPLQKLWKVHWKEG